MALMLSIVMVNIYKGHQLTAVAMGLYVGIKNEKELCNWKHIFSNSLHNKNYISQPNEQY